MSKLALTSLALIAVVVAWPINVTLVYENPEAARTLQLPYLKVSLTADYDPISMTMRNVSLNVDAGSEEASRTVEEALATHLSGCDLTFKVPLPTVSKCLLNSIKDFISMTLLELSPKEVGADSDLSGVAYVSEALEVTAKVPGRTLKGVALYRAKALEPGPEERLTLVLSGERAYLRLEGRSSPGGKPSPYVLVSWPEGAGVISLTSEPLTRPLLVGRTVYFKLPVVRYFIGLDKARRSYFYYFNPPTARLSLPVGNVSLKFGGGKGGTSVRAACNLNVAVLAKGSHSVSLVSPSYEIEVKAPPFAYVSVPVPCRGLTVLRVDDSVAILNLTEVVDKNLVVFPESGALRLVTINSSEPFEVVVGGRAVYCGAFCYALLPPRQVAMQFVSASKGTATSLTISPEAAEVVLNFPPAQPSRGCLVKFVAPSPVEVEVQAGQSVFGLQVTRTPTTVVLPCGGEVKLKVGRYEASLKVSSGEWVYLCPSPYALSGESIKINTTMIPPISVSCDGGLTWALVNNNTFTFVKPKYAYVLLKAVDSTGNALEVIIPEGIREVSLKPSTTSGERVVKVPLGNLDTSVKVVLDGVGEGLITLSNGTASVQYYVKGAAQVMIPRQWASQKLIFSVTTPEGALANTTLPPLMTDNKVAPIYAIINRTISVKYHSLKVVVLRGEREVTTTLLVNGRKVIVNGSAVFVVPTKTVTLKLGDKEFEALANGGTVVLRLSPQASVELAVPVTVELYDNWKPVKGLVKFSLANLTLTYPVDKKATVLLPPDALNATLRMLVVENNKTCEVKLPQLLTSVGNRRLVSSIAVEPGEGTCYVYKIVTLEEKGYLKSPAVVNVTVDGKSLRVRGSIILVYDKPTLELRLGNQTFSVSAGGTVYLYAKPKERGRAARNATAVAPPAISVVNITEKWNPVGELPGVLSLSAGMLLALGVMNSIEPSTPLYATAYAVASLSFIMGILTVSIILLKYFSTG